MRTSHDVTAEAAYRLSQSRQEAVEARHKLTRFRILIVLQWVLIIWLIWFRKGC
jgi:hypothetical protein